MQIDWLAIKHLSDGNVQAAFYDHSPVYIAIPLTEQILIDCGFKKFVHEPGYSIGSDEKTEKFNEYCLEKLSIMDLGYGFIMSNSFSFDLRVELESLHQLQNLFFALTGKELNVQLSEPKVE